MKVIRAPGYAEVTAFRRERAVSSIRHRGHRSCPCLCAPWAPRACCASLASAAQSLRIHRICHVLAVRKLDEGEFSPPKVIPLISWPAGDRQGWQDGGGLNRRSKPSRALPACRSVGFASHPTMCLPSATPRLGTSLVANLVRCRLLRHVAVGPNVAGKPFAAVSPALLCFMHGQSRRHCPLVMHRGMRPLNSASGGRT